MKSCHSYYKRRVDCIITASFDIVFMVILLLNSQFQMWNIRTGCYFCILPDSMKIQIQWSCLKLTIFITNGELIVFWYMGMLSYSQFRMWNAGQIFEMYAIFDFDKVKIVELTSIQGLCMFIVNTAIRYSQEYHQTRNRPVLDYIWLIFGISTHSSVNWMSSCR